MYKDKTSLEILGTALITGGTKIITNVMVRYFRT